MNPWAKLDEIFRECCVCAGEGLGFFVLFKYGVYTFTIF